MHVVIQQDNAVKVLMKHVEKPYYHTEQRQDGLKLSIRDVMARQIWLDQVAVVSMTSKCKHCWTEVDVTYDSELFPRLRKK
ncbi:hypothetical protein Trydic_g7128 [Trypoxylus dichotomus]